MTPAKDLAVTTTAAGPHEACSGYVSGGFDICTVCGLFLERHSEGWPFPCCDHCGCGTPGSEWEQRTGHDDPCHEGCNDAATEGDGA